MRFESVLFVALAGVASAHYTFNSLILNGVVTPQWQYVRRHTKGIDPNHGNQAAQMSSPDFRCNLGSGGSGPGTQVATVAPGQRIGFKSYYGFVEHPGPMQVYMSKAPGSVQSYDGSGDWFKIDQRTVCGDMSNGIQDQDWCTWGKNEFFFNIPNGTPPGEYLVRIEHIALHGAHGANPNPEFYFSCAQVKVTGSGTGTPGPLVKIPGLYNIRGDPAINFNIYANPRSYPGQPGPAVWTGGSSSGGGGTTTPPPTTPPPSGGCAAKYAQCGGIGFSGPTSCCSGSTCTKSNDYYSQCL